MWLLTRSGSSYRHPLKFQLDAGRGKSKATKQAISALQLHDMQAMETLSLKPRGKEVQAWPGIQAIVIM